MAFGKVVNVVTASQQMGEFAPKGVVMKVRLLVDKVAALKAGLDEYGTVVVEVPAHSLSPKHRELLAEFEFCGVRDNPPADFYLDGREETPVLESASPEKVPFVLDAILAHREAKKKREEEYYENEVKEWLVRPIRDFLLDWYPFKVKEGSAYDVFKDPRLASKLEEAKALAATLKAEHEKEKENTRREEAEKESREKAEEKAKLNQLREWAVQNGSETLRYRVEDGYEWQGLAEREYADSVMASLALGLPGAGAPDGYKKANEEVRTTPTLKEIQTVRNVRKLAEGKPVEVSLVWCKYAPKSDPDSYDYDDPNVEKIGRTFSCELKVLVTCPTGRQIAYYRLCE